MSNDISNRLRETGEDGGRPLGFGAADVLRVGRARRRRHRVVGGSATVLGVAAAALAVVTAWPSAAPHRAAPPATHHSHHNDSVDPNQGASTGYEDVAATSDFDPTPLTPEDALNRCVHQVANHEDPFVANHTGWTIQDIGPNDFGPRDKADMITEGSLLQLLDGTTAVGVACSVPQVDRMDQAPVYRGPIAAADDFDGIREQCTAASGYDFSGWQVSAAMGNDHGFAAALTSANGYRAMCLMPRWREQVRPPSSPLSDRYQIREQYVHIWPTPLGPDHREGALNIGKLPEDQFPIILDNVYDRTVDAEWLLIAAGTLPDADPQAREIRFELPNGEVLSSEVHDSAYALWSFVRDDSAEPMTVEVLDGSGKVLDHYRQGFVGGWIMHV